MPSCLLLCVPRQVFDTKGVKQGFLLVCAYCSGQAGFPDNSTDGVPHGITCGWRLPVVADGRIKVVSTLLGQTEPVLAPGLLRVGDRGISNHEDSSQAFEPETGCSRALCVLNSEGYRRVDVGWLRKFRIF